MKQRLHITVAIMLVATAIVTTIGLSSVRGEYNSRRLVLYDGEGIVELAAEYLGVPYRSGGATPAGFDCSGFTSYVYSQAGYHLPRQTGDQFRALGAVRSPEPGDLLFFKIDGESISHVGIYVGDYQFIHAPSSGKTVSYADMRSDYWKSRYVGARSMFR